MEIFAMFVVGIFLSLNASPTKADELTLRNQLMADVYLLKEGVDKLLISTEILNKRFNNQMDILKTVENKLQNVDFETRDANCDKITGMYNVALKKQNVFESRLIGKLEEMQEDQLVRFEEMLLKLRLNKNCGTQPVALSTLTLLCNTLSEVSEKVDHFGEKIAKLNLLEEQLSAQQIKFDKFAENQERILQQINDKLNNNHDHFGKVNQDLENLTEMNTDLKKTTTHPRPKLSMEVVLGLTSANVTNFS